MNSPATQWLIAIALMLQASCTLASESNAQVSQWAQDAERIPATEYSALVKSALAGDRKALYQSYTLTRKPGFPSDLAVALAAVIARHSEQGDALGLSMLCGLKLHGAPVANVDQDKVAAMSVCRQAANAGASAAMLQLGYAHEVGLGVPKDPAQALSWYLKAAEAGSWRASAYVGALYETGRGAPKNLDLALDWYRKGAAAGDGWSMNNLGRVHQHGIGVPMDPAQALSWYQKAAEAGVLQAIASVGVLYESGQGASKNLDLALEWYRKGAAAGDGWSMTNLGRVYQHGIGVPKDPAQALSWYQRAAEAGVLQAMASVGGLYESGQGAPKNLDLALEWYRKGAAASDGWSMNNLGRVYQHGIGVPKDPAQALNWYQKAAEAGVLQAMASVGWLFESGHGAPKNLDLALEWYRKGAAAGDGWSMNNLGRVHQHGIGVAKDPAQALNWYQKAAEAGISQAMAQLAWIYETGQGTSRNLELAFAWYQKAASVGDGWSMQGLGRMYETGLGVTKDPARAFDWYRRSSAAGDSEGMRQLGFAYLYGRGTAEDKDKAFELFQKSVSAGSIEALVALAWMHERGQATPQDTDRALQIYRKAADAGVTGAMFNLGTIHANGKLVPKNVKLGLEWFEKAAAGGHVNALEQLARWKEQGSRDQASFNVPINLCLPILGCTQVGNWDAGKTFTTETVTKDPDEALRLLNRAYQLATGDKREELRQRLGIIAEERPIQDAQLRAQVSESFKPAPELAWVRQPATVQDEYYEFAIELKDAGGGIGDVKFSLDGVAFDPGTARGLARMTGAGQVREFKVKLPPGSHEIAVSAYNGDNVKNFSTIRANVVSTYRPVRKPQLFALVVGIDQYNNDALTLRYAGSDAAALREVLKLGAGKLFDESHIKLLSARETTGKRAILAAIDDVAAAAQTEDVFVFYVAGHGINDSGYKLLTSDVRYLSGDRLAAESISAEELQAAIYKVPSAKKLVLLDTCHSGGAVRAESILATRGLTDLEMVKRMNRLSGAVVIAAAETKEQALEGYQGHGVFTYALLEALRGKADANKDGYVSTRELQDYVETRASEIAEQVFKAKQTPYPSSVGSGFMVLAH